MAIANTNPALTANNSFVNAVYKQKYGAEAPQSILQEFSGKKVFEVANGILGGSSPFKDFSTGPVDPSKPIPVNGLTGKQELSRILGANIPSSVNGDIAGLLALYGKNTQASDSYDALTNELIKKTQELSGQGADMQAALEAQGVPQAFEQAKQLNLRGAQLQGELEQFDAETTKLSSTLEDQAIPTGLIQGQQAVLAKQRALTRSSKAAELASTVALSQAFQGNAAIGQQLAKQAIDLKYAPIQNNIDVLTQQLGFAKDKMTRDEQKRASIIDSLIQSKQSELNDQRAVEQKIMDLKIDAAGNGAPLSLINSLQGITDPAKAASTLSSYLTSTINRRNTESKNAGSPGFLDSKVESDIRADAHALADQVNSGAKTLQAAYKELRTLYSTKEATDLALQDLLGYSPDAPVGTSKSGTVIPEDQRQVKNPNYVSPVKKAVSSAGKFISSIGMALFSGANKE